MDISALLPPYLNLPPHLSGHKYFFVCTLTIAAWDTLVLSPRSWRLLKTKEWPVLKIVYQFLRYLMPVEFIAVGVAFFDTKFTRSMCDKFYMFEPICTMILLAMCSAVHVIRIYAIFDKSRPILAGLSALLLLQVSSEFENHSLDPVITIHLYPIEPRCLVISLGYFIPDDSAMPSSLFGLIQVNRLNYL
jgi:hypothetical protein